MEEDLKWSTQLTAAPLYLCAQKAHFTPTIHTSPLPLEGKLIYIKESSVSGGYMLYPISSHNIVKDGLKVFTFVTLDISPKLSISIAFQAHGSTWSLLCIVGNVPLHMSHFHVSLIY